MKFIPTLVKDKNGWTIDQFRPSQPAFRWDEFERKNAVVYMIRVGEYLKIGVTRDLGKRLRQIESGTPVATTIVGKLTVPLASMLITEAWLHQRFAAQRVKNEWFLLTDEEALSALPEAAAFARAYARCCRDWFARDQVARINGGV